MTSSRLEAAAGPRGLVIAAPASGCGKTTVTLALLRRLRNAGMAVASAKVGPDYIDPAFHAAASGRPCVNLDPWAMTPERLATLARDAAASADLTIVEGVMGLFDGAADGRGSTADLAALFGWPVVLVLNARGQGASAAAVAEGFRRHRADVRIAGVICNAVASERHADLLASALAPLDPVFLGCLPRDPSLALPARHLGLVQASEQADLEDFLERAAAAVDAHLDWQALAGLATPAQFRESRDEARNGPPLPLGQRIAVARDAAFGFAYPHLLAAWRQAGAEVMPFSPLADEVPDASCDAVYLPGGYPELHAGRLAGKHRFFQGLRSAAAQNVLIYGECGGYMVLGESLTDADGKPHAMAGLLPLATSFQERRLHLGYRALSLAADCRLGKARQRWRGHEFHYATVVREDHSAPLFHCSDAAHALETTAGSRRGSVLGSFMHIIDRE